MFDKQRIREAVFGAIDRVNEVLVDDQTLAKDDGTVLIGDAAQLDSMGFVNFVVALEEAAQDKFGVAINLAEEINAPGANTPDPMTVAGLIEFLHEVLRRREAKRSGA